VLLTSVHVKMLVTTWSKVSNLPLAGGTNHHKGNKLYRKMVEDRKIDYINSKRLDKPLVALSVIQFWRGQDPPGRFLKLDEKTKKWNDVGDKKAREKTSQALREKAPIIRKKQEEERRTAGGENSETEDAEDDSDEPSSHRQSTRFADGTTANEGKKVGKPVLARDHTLGREYLEPDEAMTLDGFSWQDPFRIGTTNSPDGPERRQSQGSFNNSGGHGGFDTRITSHGSMGGDPYRYPSHGSMGPPPPPQGYGGTEAQFRYTTSGRYESWSNGMSPHGSMPPPMSGYAYPHVSGGWEREHSLGQNPLPHASIGHPAHYAAFDGRATSGHWGPPIPPNVYPPMAGPPSYTYSGGSPSNSFPPPGREYSGGHSQEMRHSPIHGPRGSAPTSPQSPRYEVDPAVASSWSGQNPMDVSTSWSGSSREGSDRFRTMAPHGHEQKRDSSFRSDGLPKPDFVKRATSNQNETLETKPDLRGPSVKRAALNRDNSLASNQLKEKYLPDFYVMKKFDHDREMRMLSDNLEQSTLDNSIRPKSLERVSTMDMIALDLMIRPDRLSASNRSTTLDALNLDFDEDALIRPEALTRTSTLDDLIGELKDGVTRPGALSELDRLTTEDFLFSMVNDPIQDDELELISGQR
jgi:hypothetical protein